MLKVLKYNSKNSHKNLKVFLEKRKSNQKNLATIVRKIIKKVKKNGDRAVLKYEKKFSNGKIKSNKILLIGIVSNKNSNLFRSANIKLLIPEVIEAGYGIVPTSSTTSQLSLGDAISMALMKKRNFGKLDFKKFHPSGNLANKLRTAGDLMLVKNRIPFVNENETMKNALKILNK